MGLVARTTIPLTTSYQAWGPTIRTFPAGFRKMTVVVDGGEAYAQVSTEQHGGFTDLDTDHLFLPTGYVSKTWPTTIYAVRFRASVSGATIALEVS